MKKITFMATTAIAIATMMTSCNMGNPKATLKTDLDTLGYAFGGQLGNDIANQQKMGQLPVDSAYLADFIKGVREGFKTGDNKKRQAYYVGVSVGQYLSGQAAQYDELIANYDSTKVLPRNNVLAAFIKAFEGRKMRLSNEQMDSAVYGFRNAAREKSLEKKYGDNRRKSEEFIAEKAQEDGIQKTTNGVLYRIITNGTGEKPQLSERVKLDYEGSLMDGTVFDSSFQRGEPITLSVGSVIPGFSEVLQEMPMGSEWEVFIPQDLAYGAQEAGTIPPFSALTFRIKVHEIVK
ncbi:MAG: FKBP-type peptidyl-prolyl cis-trans isomerase [Prevotella sp.]|nr:FKBP-type peptidyl-prolyl cis-trans isomerase [Prevotella sp.]